MITDILYLKVSTYLHIDTAAFKLEGRNNRRDYFSIGENNGIKYKLLFQGTKVTKSVLKSF